MKKYKKLLSFGCSFTQGGGLNSQKFHRWLEHGMSLPEDVGTGPNENLLQEHEEYANHHSYPGYLSRKLECEFVNFGLSGASNEYIFKRAYEEISKSENPAETLITIQTSLLNRLYLQVPGLDMPINMNNLETARGYFPDSSPLNDIVYEYYKSYIGHFYDEKAEYEKLRLRIDTTAAYAKEKGVDVAFLIYLQPGYHPFIQHQGIVDLLNYSDLAALSCTERMNIWTYTNGRYKDLHFSPFGNSVIANLIYRHLENKSLK
jgi:hypothetical protein